MDCGCLQRARKLRLEDGTADRFICPFHGWRWNMEGENTFVYGKHFFSEGLLDQADLALTPCRVETAIGCAFINFDNDAPSLHEALGPTLVNLEAHGIGNLRSEWWYATVLPANWKIAMEAFMEGYHVMRTHPQLQRAVPQLWSRTSVAVIAALWALVPA